LEDFIFNESPTQLTFRGLLELHRTIKENELCVFFRNNHFSTLLKRNDLLYLLLTDEGFKHSDSAVWEILNEISGDTQFVDADFKLHVPTPRDMTVEKSLLKAKKEESSVEEESEESAETREMEELKKLNLNDNEIIKQIELRKSEKLALKLQKAEEKLLTKEQQKKEKPAEMGIKEAPSIDISSTNGEEKDEVSLLRKSEKLALALQKQQDEEQSLALARSLQEEDERMARAIQDEDMARKLQQQFNQEAEQEEDSASSSDSGRAPEPSKPRQKPRAHGGGHHGHHARNEPATKASGNGDPTSPDSSSKQPGKDKKKKDKGDDCSLQ
jgi:hypothetical protein